MSSSDAQNRFINEALAAHNEYRYIHGVPALVHNPELSAKALKWAINIAGKNMLEHSSNKYKNEPLGENIAMWFMTGADHYDGKVATQQWYDEIKDYKWSRAEFAPETGHFTQVVWKNSKEVGFAVAIAPNGYFYAVANYYPAGNFKNQFQENVLPPSKKPDINKIKTQETRQKPTIVNKQPTKKETKEIVNRDYEYKNTKYETAQEEEEEKPKKGCC